MSAPSSSSATAAAAAAAAAAKIPIPVSLTATTPSLPSESQQALIHHLQETGSLGELSSLLRDSLARSGWTDRVKALSLELLRNGTCATFPELMTEVMRRATLPKVGAVNGNNSNNNNSNNNNSNNNNTAGAASQSNGTTSTNTSAASASASAAAAGTGQTSSSQQQQQQNGMNGAGSIVVAKEWTGGPDGLPDVRVPNNVVEVGVEFLEDKIKDACYRVDDDGEPVS